MTQVVSLPARRSDDWRVVAPVCAAHFLSHYYMIMLAPLFAFVRADYDVSYTQLALALTAFNVISAALQTPVGFVVDRVGARVVLILGVALGTIAFAVAGLVHSFVVFIAMYAVAGLGNTTYHPADYSLLSRHSAPARLGQIFSYHTFAGMLGAAVAPPTLLAMQSRFGWRGAYVGAAMLGVAVLALLITWRSVAAGRPGAKSPASDRSAHIYAPRGRAGWRVLLSAPILLSMGFFVLLSLMGGISSFLVVALAALHSTPEKVANTALTGFLIMNAAGVLVGGVLASRVQHHATVAGLSLAIAGIGTALVGIANLSSILLVAVTSLSGLFVGVTSPSRDMLVRAATPEGAFGRVFGFVSTGFNIGAAVAPAIYGVFMDHGEPRAVFLFSAACCILGIGTVMFGLSGRERR